MVVIVSGRANCIRKMGHNAALISRVWLVATAVLSLPSCGTTMGEASNPLRPGALYYKDGVSFPPPRSGDATSAPMPIAVRGTAF
jgi:hypothetical protein